MSEEKIFECLNYVIDKWTDEKDTTGVNYTAKCIKELINLYQKEKEKNKELENIKANTTIVHNSKEYNKWLKEKLQMVMNGGLKMNKITVIELLNKIANGEDISYSVKISEGGSRHAIYNLKKEIVRAMFVANVCEGNLNKEVEIIEDTETIRPIDISEWNEITYEYDWELLKGDFNKNSNTFVNKINELIDKVNMIEDNMNHIPRID